MVEVTLDSDIPAATQLLSPRNFMNNGATAATVADDCSGVYVETDYYEKWARVRFRPFQRPRKAAMRSANRCCSRRKAS